MVTLIFCEWDLKIKYKPCTLPPQTMDIVDMAIYQVVCQKSDSHRNSAFQNSKTQNPLLMSAKKISGQNMLAF
jgi:hypothetical protein